jgi:hypothetical protein
MKEWRIAPYIHKFGNTWRWSTSHPARFTPAEGTRYSFDRRLGSPHSRNTVVRRKLGPKTRSGRPARNLVPTLTELSRISLVHIRLEKLWGTITVAVNTAGEPIEIPEGDSWKTNTSTPVCSMHVTTNTNARFPAARPSHLHRSWLRILSH